jgi:anti-anti-sigma regulatory factor
VLSVPTGAGARIEARHDTMGGVIITVGGDLGRNDAAVLSRQLHTALETTPSVVVLNVRAVTGTDPCVHEVLAVAQDRARTANIALHVVDPHHHLTDDQ